MQKTSKTHKLHRIRSLQFITIVGLIMIISAISFSTLSAQNVFSNGGFEEGTTDWAFKIGGTSTGQMEISTTNPHNSSNCLKVTVATIGTNPWEPELTKRNFSVTKGNIYALTFFAKSETNGYQTGVGVTSTEASGFQWIGGTDLTLTDQWQQYQFTFSATATTNSDIQMSIRLGKQTGVVYFDDFYLEELSNNWLADAEADIKEIRRGNFSIKVLDKDGNLHTDSIKIDLIKHEFEWGTALAFGNNEDDWMQANAVKYFNYGVCENDFKWSGMQANEGPVNYTKVETYLDWADKVGWKMRGHTLLWGGDNDHNLPSWVRSQSSEDIIEACKERVESTVSYFKGRITDYDVMNEAITGHASWLQEKVGESINWNSFKWAEEVDPDANFYINDYSVISGNATSQYKTMIQTMLDNGAPVDGIGVQSHFGGNAINILDVKNKLDDLATLGLPIKITEFDMGIGDANASQEFQAENYSNMMRLAFSHPSINGFLFWGFWDGRHWRDKAGIIDINKVPKIAADSVYNLIHNVWSTNIKNETNENGNINFDAFYGKYEIRVKFGDTYKLFTIDASKVNEGNEITLNEADGLINRPEFLGSKINGSGAVVSLYFDKEMDIETINNNSFTIYTKTKQSIKSVRLNADDSRIVELELNTLFSSNEYGVVFYQDNTIKSTDGGELAFVNPEEIENYVPSFVSAVSLADGYSVEIKFNRELNELDNQNESFLFTINGEQATIASSELKENDATTVILTLATPINFQEILRLNYTPGNITSVEGAFCQAFGPRAVSNKVPTTTAINKLDNSNIKAYFNNSTKTIVVSNNYENKDEFYYHLYSITGAKLQSGKLNSGNQTIINTSNYSPGLVIIRFDNYSRQINQSTKILVK